jgi:hypothetical protein
MSIYIPALGLIPVATYKPTNPHQLSAPRIKLLGKTFLRELAQKSGDAL